MNYKARTTELVALDKVAKALKAEIESIEPVE